MDSGLGFVQPMFFIGVVEDRNDPRSEGRVRVRAFGVHGSNEDIPTEDLPWATLILGHHDVNFTPPPLNAWVFGFFIDGRDAQQPMILGLIPAQIADVVNPAGRGWGSVSAENHDIQSQGSRPQEIGQSPLPPEVTGENRNFTYDLPLETNRTKNIPIAGGCARGHNAVGNGNSSSVESGEGLASETGFDIGTAGPGLTPERQEQLLAFAARNNINPNALAGVLNIESGFDPNIRGGAGGNFYGIFQLQNTQIPGLTQRALGRSLSPEEYRGLSFGDQLNVYQQYINQWVPDSRSFFTGDAAQDASRLWSLQLAPGRTATTDFSNPNATISATNQAAAISARPGLVTVGSVQSGTLQRGGLLDIPSDPTRLSEARSARQDLVDSQRVLSEADILRSDIRRLESQRDSLDPTFGGAESERDELERQIAEKNSELESLNDDDPTSATEDEPYSGYANPSNDPSCATTWDEPPSGYDTKYPFNRVVKTAGGHVVELDDTPGSERVTVWHKDGSYMQMTGTSTTHKNMSDFYEVNERNQHVYVGGNNIITIEGDSYVLVKGNKVEEIEGDYKQIVHGNIQMGAAQRIEVNAGDRADISGAAIGIDSNVENMNIRTSKHIVFESGETFNVKSKNVNFQSSENMSVLAEKDLFLRSSGGDIHTKSDGNIHINPDQNMYLRTEAGSISMQSKGSFRVNAEAFVALKSDGYTSIRSDANMLLQSTGETINIRSAELMAIRADSGGIYVNSSAGDFNLKVSGGVTNIDSEDDITINTPANIYNQAEGEMNFIAESDFNVQATGDTNVKAQNVNIEGLSEIDIKAGGAGYVEAGAVLNLLAGSDARLTGSNAHIRGTTTFIDDIVQLGNGGATPANPADGANDANEGNEVDEKEPLDPTQYDLGEGEMGTGDVAAQAAEPSIPKDVQELSAGENPPPPDVGSDNPEDMWQFEDDRRRVSSRDGVDDNQFSDSPFAPQQSPRAPERPAGLEPPAAPIIPTQANVADEATQRVQFGDVLVFSTSGTDQNPRANIRNSEGRIVTVRPGETINGRTITGINPSSGEVFVEGGQVFRVPE